MTCFRIDGKTVKKYCMENNLNYSRFYYWMEHGLSVKESIKKIEQSEHNGRKWMYNKVSVFMYCKNNDLLYNTVVRFIKKGLSIEDAIKKAEKLRHKKGRPPKYEYKGISLEKYCNQTIFHRLRKGMDIEEAIRWNKNV